ncbi:MAG: tRNA pseudouridine(38-40) synthase TruA [Lachnospiraceae bacterium]|nr:tRNA pseudouridine(38-40) synthase TruA [Lachnospiraceae bacterium]
MRIRLQIAYDGTAYCGFQCQTNGVAVQDLVNQACTELFKTPIKTIGASRTDAGVHAEGNVAVFDAETRIDPSKIAFALNARLPEDIRIVKSDRVPDDWHPRFQSTIKTYEYRILNRVHPDPLSRHTEMHYYYPLDEKKMNEAAAFIEGEHDFASFCAAGYSSKTTVRTIYACRVIREGERVTIRITGNGFLYNMVRIIAGTLLEVGGGKYPPEHVKEILEAKNRSAAGPTAIAKGLVLMRIVYPEDAGREMQEVSES